MPLVLRLLRFSGFSPKFVKFQDFFRTMKSVSFFRTFPDFSGGTHPENNNMKNRKMPLYILAHWDTNYMHTTTYLA